MASQRPWWSLQQRQADEPRSALEIEQMLAMLEELKPTMPQLGLLAKPVCKRLCEVATTVTFEAGQWICRQGEAAEHFYIILSGGVQVCREHAWQSSAPPPEDDDAAHGTLQLIATLFEGDAFGEQALSEDVCARLRDQVEAARELLRRAAARHAAEVAALAAELGAADGVEAELRDERAATSEVLVEAFEQQVPTLSAAASQRVRLGWWLASILASFGFYSSLEYLTAFVGLNSLLISVLLPIFFYLRLHRRLSGARAAALYALLALSVVLSVVIGYLDIAQYIASLSGEVDADGEPLR